MALCAVTLVILWPSKAGSPEEQEALRQARTVIVYWDRHSGHEHEARRVLIDEFNQSQDAVYVRALPVGYDASMQKLLTAIAGGCAPDICGMDGTILAQLSAQGCFSPLNDLTESDPHLGRDAFFPNCWDAVVQDGNAYGIPTTQDTYCLLWNKDAFRKAGLDPERPPRTFAELDAYAAKLTIQDETGIKQAGFLPWQSWDHTYMIGMLFGGTWFDEAADRMVCVDDPSILRSLNWQRSYAIDPESDDNPPQALDPTKTSTFSKSFGSYMSANNQFYTGKVAMILEGEWQCTFIPKYAPDLDWGVAPVPVPEGADPVAWSPTSIADAVPTGCRNREAVYTFLRWFHTPRPDGRPSPASDYCHAIHNIPVRPSEATQERFINDPKFKMFVDSLLTRRIASAPVMPVTQFMNDEVERLRAYVTTYQMTPEDMLTELEDKVNAELRRQRFFIERSRR
ncbi:MAG: ABC transporter substrate-binding protein [bacterium]|nr:ABC transporter substrate-binding protein [bacterium]